MHNRFFTIIAALIGVLIVGMIIGTRVLTTGGVATTTVAEASDDSAGGEEDTEYC